MKKFLAIFLTIAMLATTCIAFTFTSSAATTKAIKLDGGYIQTDSHDAISGGYTVSFDMWAIADGSGIQLWADTASTRYTVNSGYVGVANAGGGSAYAADNFVNITWGTIGLANTGSMHSFKIEINNAGSDIFYMDGAQVLATGQTANSFWTEFEIWNTEGSGVVIDNFKITSIDGATTYVDYDFEDSDVGIFGSNATLLDQALPKVETVKSKGLFLDSGYIQTADEVDGNAINALGSQPVFEFDMWVADADSGLQLWADTAATRYTVTGTYVGADNTGGGSAYTADSFTQLAWDKDVGFASDGWHHFKFELNKDDTHDVISRDGVVVWDSGTVTANAYWTGTLQIWNTIGNGVVIDNMSYKNNGVYTFEDGTNDVFRASDYGSIMEMIVVKGDDEVQMSKAVYLNAGYLQWNDLDDEIGSSYTIQFDMWTFDADSGIQLWADTAATRYTVTGTYVGVDVSGGGSAYPADDYVNVAWGEGTGFASDNWHTVKMELNKDGSDLIYIDGILKYNSNGITANSYWTGTIQLMNTLGNGVAIDNLSITGNTTQGPWDFEDDSCYPFSDCSIIDVAVAGSGKCVDHVAGNPAVTVEPTCFSTGTSTVSCIICGKVLSETAIPMIAHDWPDGDSADVVTPATATTPGRVSFTCNREGCGAKIYATTPATNAYTGTIDYIIDFSDVDVVRSVYDIFGGCEDKSLENIANNVLTIAGGNEGQNYYYWNSKAESTNNFSLSYDINVSGTEVLDNVSYGSQMYFWFGGENTIFNQAGYDFTNGCFFMKPNDGSSYATITVPYAFSRNMWHNVRLSVTTDDAAFKCTAVLYFDNVAVLTFGGAEMDDAYWSIPLETARSFNPILRIFNVQGQYDNFVAGSSDFAWATKGDSNGDGKVNMLDMLTIRKAIAEVGEISCVESQVDFNHDGFFNLLDVLAFRKIIAAA